MKRHEFKGTFLRVTEPLCSSFTYSDTVSSLWEWTAKIGLKMRNSAKMIKIERI